MVIVVMGTTGAGKTTVASLLAERLGWRFADADDFHSEANIEKMRRGVPLDDADRLPWLRALRQAIEGWVGQGAGVILACSALKRAYREELRVESHVVFVYLGAAEEVLQERIESREGHFARADLLESQLEALEEPGPDEPAITVDGEQKPPQIVAEVVARLGLEPKQAY